MAILDHAVWLSGSGFAEGGTTTISEGGNSTTVTGSFTANSWDANANGTGVSDFGAAFVDQPITADYSFSNPVENLAFAINHVNGQAPTYDDFWTIAAYDENGVLIPAADVIAGLGNVQDELIVINPDGTVSINSDGTTPNDITVNLAGPISQISLTYENGPEGTLSGGSGISDFSFTVPAGPDYVVSGTGNGDLIDEAYLGDPEGDRVNNADHIDGSDSDLILAGAGDDTVFAGVGDDTVDGGAGNDLLEGQDGNDTLIGGTGDDTMEGGDGADSIVGGAGSDLVYAGWDMSDDTVDGGLGNDHIYVGDGDDSVQGGAGRDWINGGWGNDVLEGDAGDDRIVAYDGNDTVRGGAGNDTLTGGAGADLIEGGDGADAIWGSGGDTIVGGEGGIDADVLNVANVQSISYNTAESGTVFFNDGTSLVFSEIETVNTLANNYIVEGTAGNDTIGEFYFDADGDWVDNSDAADGSHDDVILAGGGDDQVWSGAGNDSVQSGTGNDRVDGGAGNDTIFGDAGNDTLLGRWGDDQIDAGLGDDSVRGGDGADSITGWAGNDILDGGAGSDTIFGADGSDTIFGGTGDDTLDGDDAFATGGADSIEGGAGNDQIIGDVGNDTLIGGDGNDTVFAGDDDDIVLGGAGQDALYGQSGDDTMDGGAGADTIIADQGDDIIYGGDGADSISGGLGNDTIYGGGNPATSTGGTNTLSYTYSVFHLGHAPEADVVDGNATNEDPNAFLGTYGGPDNELYNYIQTATTVDTDGNTRINNADTEAPAETVTIDGVAHTIDLAVFQDGTVTFTDGTTGTITALVVQTTDGNVYMFPQTSNNASHALLTSKPIESIEFTSVVFPYNNVTAERMDGDYVLPGDPDTSADSIDAGSGNDVVFGGAGNDTLAGQDGDDSIEGGLGDDSIAGGTGRDTVDGGAGDDWVSGGTGEDTVIGGAGNDSVYGAEGNDVLYGDAGNDSMEGWLGNDTIYGGTGDDYQDGADGDDLLVGQEGNDTLLGGNDGGQDTLQGGAGNDSLSAGAGNDTLLGGTGDDTQFGAGGDDTFVLQTGFGNDVILGGETGETTGDTLDASSISQDLTVDLSASGSPTDPESGTISDGTGTTTFAEIENITTGAGNDSVRGSGGDDTVSTGAGADTVDGGAGNDVFDIGAADGAVDFVILEDGDGDDTVTGFEAPLDNGDGTFTGRDQLDVSGLTSDGTTPVNTADVTVTDDGSGNAVLNFTNGESITLIGVAPSQVDSHEELAAMGIPRVPLDYVVEGTDNAELINAGYDGDPEGDKVDAADNLTNDNDDVIRAGGGNDTIGAGVGNDSIDAGTGDDQVFGETGNDTVDGGLGNDSIFGETGDDSLIGADGNDTLLGGAGHDVLLGGNDDDSLRGDAGNDTLEGGAGDDYLHGGDGNDSMLGGAGDDEMHGWNGDDTMSGGDGNDSLDGDLGSDLLIGGAGNDTITAGISIESDTLQGGSGDDYLDGMGGNDLIEGGTGNDSMLGSEGDDTFALEDNFGNDTIVGGEFDEFGGGDTLDLSGTTTGVTVDLSDANAETGTVSNGTATAGFTQIENIILGAGIDTVVLADGSGSDTVQGFAPPIDNGDGTFTGQDQLDVSGMTDANGAQVNTGDVVVSDDGSGNAVLNFPGGETLTLIGIAPSELSDPLALQAMGIPKPNYVVEGTAGADTIDAGYVGDPEGDMVDDGDSLANNDDDRIEAGAGDDIIASGAGNDHVEAGIGNDSVNAGAGNDTIQGLAGNDTVFGEAGDDLIDDEFGPGTNGAGDDYFDGGTGNDEIYGGIGNDTIIGGDGADLLGGEEGNDLIQGGADADTISVWGPFGDDMIDGGETVTTGVDFDEIDASGTGTGVDVSYTGSEAGTMTDGFGTAEFTNIEGLTLTAQDDVVDGALDASGLSINAGAGADSITGGTGNDSVDMGAGDGAVDTFAMADGGGDDTLGSFEGPVDNGDGTFTGRDQLNVSNLTDAGGDPVTVTDVTVLDDGSGNAVLSFPNGETITLLGIASANVTSHAALEAMGIPNGLDYIVEGTAGNDTIDDSYSGDPEGDMVDAGDSQTNQDDDSIEAGAGDDIVIAGAGNDTVRAGAGNDSVEGGLGDDRIFGFEGSDTVDGGAGDDYINTRTSPGTGLPDQPYNDPGNPSISYAGDPDPNNDRDSVLGGLGNDTILTGDDDDTIDAGAGDDSIDAGFDDDLVIAGAGNDTVEGGEGSDTVEGGDGNDVIYGGLSPTNPDAPLAAPYELPNDGSDAAPANNADDLRGGAGDDLIFGQDDNDILRGGDGDDTLDGGIDDDTLVGGLGNDSLIGGDGNDEIFAENGQDTVLAGAGNDTVHASTGSDLIYGGAGDDDITGGGFSNESDTIFGEAGNDIIDGGLGGDLVDGGTGNDTITARQDDTLTGGDGDDLFILTDPTGEPGAGTITITGGEGNETTGDTLQLTNEIARDDITFTNLDDNAAGLSGTFTMSDGTVVNFFEIENIICFTPGANILTSHGERTVETLQVGDLVVTRDHGLRPIRWIGQRTVRGHGDFAPIAVNSSVTDSGRAPLIVSPQHRILFTGYRAELLFGESEVLVPAKHLVDGTDVVQTPCDEVTYIHIMFDRHEVIYAEGIATESFHAGDVGLNAIEAAAREELFAIFPELRTAPGHHGETARTCLKKHEALLLMDALKADR